jgi:hypothetical protein
MAGSGDNTTIGDEALAIREARIQALLAEMNVILSKEQDDEARKLVSENISRNREIFEGFNPITGKGCPGERTVVRIPDCPVKKMLMPTR